MKRNGLWISVVVGAGLLAGCARPQTSPWKPPPPVRWIDIATDRPPPIDNGFLLYESELSHGRFPVTIAVSRVSIRGDEPAKGMPPLRTPYLATRPRNEFLRWNSTFDDLMAVSEVFPIAQRDLGGAESTPSQILAASRALDARLTLIYGMNELSETESEMFGALYETAGAKPIAVLHARAESLVGEHSGEPPRDHWETDSRALVRRRFAMLAHGCVRELILRDRREAIEDKSGWIPVQRFLPVEWPPKMSSPGP